jgi:hypothetical protein
MAKPLVLWLFILANTLLFITSSIMLLLSSFAYYRYPRSVSYRYSTIGFGFIVLGGLVPPVYRLFIQSSYRLNVTERLLLQSGEGLLLAIGLGLLFYAITRHDSRSPRRDNYSKAFETNLSEIDDYRYNR